MHFYLNDHKTDTTKIITNRKAWTILTACCLLSLSSKAQNFFMSSVSAIPGTSSNATAVNFKSNAICLDVQSGLAVLSGNRSIGSFSINCEIKQQFNSLGIKLYPNPAHTTTRLKCNTLLPSTENCNVSIWNTEGVMISNRKESSISIYQGISLDVTNLTAGSYILKIESAKYIDALKFIKVN